MTTLEKLRKDIAKEKAKIGKQRALVVSEAEKKRLAKELALLKNPSAMRNRELARRTLRGLKIIGRKTFKVASKQAKLIRDQQLRDEAILRKQGTKARRAIKKRGKKVRKATKTSSLFGDAALVGEGLFDL